MSGDVQDLGLRAQEHGHLVAERLRQPRLDPIGDRAGVLAVFGGEDDIAAGAERRDVPQADGLACLPQLVVRDAVTADVDASQEGGESRQGR